MLYKANALSGERAALTALVAAGFPTDEATLLLTEIRHATELSDVVTTLRGARSRHHWTDDEKDVVKKFYVDGMPIRAIAEMLGVTKNQVQGQVSELKLHRKVDSRFPQGRPARLAYIDQAQAESD